MCHSAQSLHDLYETAPGNGDLGLVDERVQSAEGATGVPYSGYRFIVLKSQCPHAASGRLNYVVSGQMTQGFALIAFPAQYDHDDLV